MKKIAILGGGITGLAAAYQLELARKKNPELDWHLYEATDRLGGTVSTTRIDTPAGRFVLEDGPDGWVTDKPWAHDLAVELGLENEIVPCNEAQRQTYVLLGNRLEPLPARMRMMVPEDLQALEGTTLFTDEARAAYARELANADALQSSAPDADESVATFIERHFGKEVLDKIGAPLLGGVFGGDAHRLSVRAVMPQFVKMEQEHGSLIAALQARARERGSKPPHPAFHSLRNGMGSLAEAIVRTLPPERLHRNQPAASLKREGKLWCLRTQKGTGKSKRHVHHVLLATPLDATRALLQPLDAEAAALLPAEASSAVLATFCWPAESASRFQIPPGFGFLVPPDGSAAESLLAATFVEQKYAGRVPAGARAIRAFFGGSSAAALMQQPDAQVASAARMQLRSIFGDIPEPDNTLTTIRRWPRSLPQYEVGHTDRIAQLETRIAKLGGLTLLGNAYHGVGVPDLIRDARAAVRAFCS